MMGLSEVEGIWFGLYLAMACGVWGHCMICMRNEYGATSFLLPFGSTVDGRAPSLPATGVRLIAHISHCVAE